MPVTFAPAKKLAESFDFNDQRLTPADILRDACHAQYKQCNEILQSSFGPSNSQDIIPTKNGFVYTVLKSYNQHRALIIRPDDVWLAILTQFNFFVNANAEVLRSQFVTHKGQKELKVEAIGNRYTVDFGHMASTMTKEIEKNVVDPALRAWILPDFTTTTTNDTIVCSIIMMATMNKYFSYKICLMCGIPRVTLEGEKADWEKILSRLEKLKEYGLQTIAWYHLLFPVISRFVRAFNAPDAEENLDFWGRVAHYHPGGSGPTWLAGWITAFCVFDEEGKWMGNQFKDGLRASPDAATLSSADFFQTYIITPASPAPYNLKLDDTPYHRIDSGDVPPGYAAVDVLLNDNGVEFKTMMTAGQVGIRICSSGDKSLSSTGERDAVEPVAGWWMFTK